MVWIIAPDCFFDATKMKEKMPLGNPVKGGLWGTGKRGEGIMNVEQGTLNAEMKTTPHFCIRTL